MVRENAIPAPLPTPISRCLGECAEGQFPTPTPRPFKGLQNKLWEGTFPPLRAPSNPSTIEVFRDRCPGHHPQTKLGAAARLIPTRGSGETPRPDSAGADRVPSPRASGREAAEQLWRPAKSEHPLKRDSGRLRLASSGGEMRPPQPAGGPHSGPSASLHWGGKK